MKTINDENQNVNGLVTKSRLDMCINLNFFSDDDRFAYEEAKKAFKDFSIVKNMNSKTLVFNWHKQGDIKIPQFILFENMKDMGLEWNFRVDTSDNPNSKRAKETNFIKDVWLKSHTLPTRYDGATFNPDPEFIATNKNLLNLWTGYIDAVKGDIKPFFDLIGKLLIGTEEQKEHFIKLLAYSFRFPHIQHGTSVGLWGEQGVGKSTIGKTIAAMCPNHCSFVNNVNDLAGFGEHFISTKFFMMEESQFSQDKGVSNMLKDLITNDQRTIKIKFLPSIKVDNYGFFIFTSNSKKCVPVTRSERRHNIYECSNILNNDHKYFAAYCDWLKNGGAAALLHYFLYEIDLEGFNPRQIVKTEGRAKLQLEQGEEFESFIYGMLHGDYEFKFEERWNSFEVKPSRAMLYEKFLHEFRDRAKYIDRTTFSKKMNEMFGFDEVNPAWNNNWKNQEKFYLLPKLHKCQEIFAAKHGGTVSDYFSDYSVPDLKPETVDVEQLKAAELETQKVLQGIKDKQTELQPFAEIEN